VDPLGAKPWLFSLPRFTQRAALLFKAMLHICSMQRCLEVPQQGESAMDRNGAWKPKCIKFRKIMKIHSMDQRVELMIVRKMPHIAHKGGSREVSHV
jgi:hypothetical protein